MRFLAPFLVPICYVLSVICLILAFLNRANGPIVIGMMVVCAIICFVFGYSTDKNNKEEKKWNHFESRIETENEVYTMFLRFDNNKIIGYNGVPMLSAATELKIKKEDSQYALYFEDQKLGYLEEDTPTFRMLDNYSGRNDIMAKAIIKKDGDLTVDIACYQS